MGYPNIINILKGNSYIKNVIKFFKSYDTITFVNPEVSNNTDYITNSLNENFSYNSIITTAADGYTKTGQLILGRQHTSGSSLLGACLLEHYDNSTWANILVGHNKDGTKICTTSASLPSKTDNSTSVATTQWVKSCIPLNLFAYGYWNKTSLVSSYNCVMSEGSGGIFNITFLSPTSDVNYIVTCVAEYDGAGLEIIGVYGYSTTGFTIDVSKHDGTLNTISTGVLKFMVWA